MRLKYLLLSCLFFVPIACFASDNAAPGFLEGRLTLLPLREVELADGTPPKVSAANYADYSLIISSRDSKKEIARVMADENGSYRIALPPGDYVLDLRRHRHVRTKAQPFTVISNQTVHVDMNIDTGVR